MDTTALVAIVGAIGTLAGASGVVAWFKLGPERGQITVNTASEAVIVHSSVLKDVKAEYQSVRDELAQTKLEVSTLEAAHENCRSEIGELKVQISFLQRDLERHGRLSELSRRKTHLALNALGQYELLADNLVSELRDRDVVITDAMRSHKLRSNFQEKMDELEDLEIKTLNDALTTKPPE